MNTFTKFLGVVGLATFFVSLVGAEEVVLQWQDNSSNELGFEIERSIDGSEFQSIGTVEEDVSTYTDSSVLIGQAALYRVRAYNHFGNSGFSNTVSIEIENGKYYLPLDENSTPSELEGKQVASLTIHAQNVTVIEAN